MALLLLLFLPACASTRGEVSATRESVAAALGQEKKVETGFLGIDRGDYDGSIELGDVSTQRKSFSALDSLLGAGFNPNDITAPDNKKAKYKSKVAKEYILDEMLTEAYAAYKEVSGKKWYPRKALKATKSNDPLLRGDRWLLRKDATLHDILLSWARKAQWHMIWRADYEYPVRVGAVFKGSFPKAVADMLAMLKKNEPRLYATFYKNRVVVFHHEEK